MVPRHSYLSPYLTVNSAALLSAPWMDLSEKSDHSQCDMVRYEFWKVNKHTHSVQRTHLLIHVIARDGRVEGQGSWLARAGKTDGGLHAEVDAYIGR